MKYTKQLLVTVIGALCAIPTLVWESDAYGGRPSSCGQSDGNDPHGDVMRRPAHHLIDHNDPRIVDRLALSSRRPPSVR